MQWLNLKAISRKVTRTEPRQRLPSLLQQPGHGPSGGTPDFDRNDPRPPTILPQGALSVHCDPSNRADEQQQARTRLDEKPRLAVCDIFSTTGKSLRFTGIVSSPFQKNILLY